jgi:hypothetical protein
VVLRYQVKSIFIHLSLVKLLSVGCSKSGELVHYAQTQGTLGTSSFGHQHYVFDVNIELHLFD